MCRSGDVLRLLSLVIIIIGFASTPHLVEAQDDVQGTFNESPSTEPTTDPGSGSLHFTFEFKLPRARGAVSPHLLGKIRDEKRPMKVNNEILKI
jgi:hypothetical protein